MTRPLLLDLFCGAGGAAMGYHRAGFDIIGVDINPQPHYPFPFIQADALRAIEVYGHPRHIDAIHASPPCQLYSIATQPHRNQGKQYPDLLPPTRALLERTGLPWVIENVPGAPMRPDFKLCGCQFGLDLRRQRWFETSWRGFDMSYSCSHPYPVPSVVGHGTQGWEIKLGRSYSQDDRKAAMGIDWMNRNELAQAIPPAYTHYIGAQLLDHLKAAA